MLAGDRKPGFTGHPNLTPSWDETGDDHALAGEAVVSVPLRWDFFLSKFRQRVLGNTIVRSRHRSSRPSSACTGIVRRLTEASQTAGKEVSETRPGDNSEDCRATARPGENVGPCPESHGPWPADNVTWHGTLKV
jgi:hypothetical protein